jgi:tagaturonate reductase
MPAEQALNIRIVADIKPYKERKVAILNGAHTALVPVAFLAGLDTVGEAMADEQLGEFIERIIFDEIVPTLDLPREELISFARDVQGRFRNPFIKHQLLSIALNGMTKFRTRLLPQLLGYQAQQGALPPRLSFALAALLAFYRGERGGQPYPLQDDQPWLDAYARLWPAVERGELVQHELVHEILGNSAHWGRSLCEIPGLVERVDHCLTCIREQGLRAALNTCC